MKQIVLCTMLLCLAVSAASAALNLEQLPPEDIERVKALITKLDPYIREREAAQDLATLTFDEMFRPLTEEEAAFLNEFKDIDPDAAGVKIPFRGIATGEEQLIAIIGQTMTVSKDGSEEARIIPPQYLPPHVFGKYYEMMNAMEREIGKRLLIESGYRSSAYQLYLFVYYLKNHEYSIKETAKFVALPGFSEHGSPEHQAIDFINQNGINGEDVPEEFEILPEYRWLQENAADYGFVLSYPREAGGGITFEPWHWRYDSSLVNDSNSKIVIEGEQ